ncbi:MAG TPA: aminotransferase class III-fold pyridoxal phosphate-dependent enzyme [Gemmatimonadales bacterium]|jgi:acetylornithine/succinyldiaminopimelate/putrescine aminotransferase|nr:aminotransferase class III-fold pyridoxal phosphate-dependent enzyme [Gemmatimonadales bacterium]
MLNSTADALLPVYAQMPVKPVSGRGSWIVDDDGNRWLDAYGGHAVAATGHSHPAVVRAISEQAAALLFYSTVLPHPNRERLAVELVRRMPAPLSRVFFANSGAEANENAMLLARKVTGRQRMVSVAGGWHGRTVACLSVTDGEKYEAGARRAGMPLSTKVPFNNAAALEQLVDDTVAALIVEPVQGMMGARDCSVEFLQAARRVTAAHGAMLIFDEIQCGVGRSGRFTAAEACGVVPDLLTMAKGLGSGLPISATVASDAIAAQVKVGDLGSTFGGGPVPCAAALATLQVMDDESLLHNVRVVSQRLRDGAWRAGVQDVQGRGLLLGLRLDRPAADVQRALFERRILTGTSSDPEVLRLMPPLSFSVAEADQLIAALVEVIA